MVIAFIPVRGGSKSIPLKNIKPLCGKPLVCWNIEALEACTMVDKIVVATDSDEIWETVSQRKYAKTVLYRRSAENATDTASTESVMLEYIQCANLSSDTTFMLVQATSPLTQTQHFSEGLDLYFSGKYDSILSCVRTYRFFWSEDGQSINYDYKNRPRRQNFKGMLMENGAFYINSVERIKEGQNRLGGKIGIYEMPEYTATEIDEPSDWIIIESLMVKHRLSSPKRTIKLFLSDVDGVLTDGGMYYSAKGDELKRFSTYDGVAFRLLKEANIKTGIITSENTDIVANRAAKLKLDYVFQGEQGKGKLETAMNLCKESGITLEEVAYIGDDLNCFDLLSQAGIAACPQNAHSKIKSIPGIIQLNTKGGDGAVREFVENHILNQ